MPIVKSYYKTLRVLPDPDYFYIQNEYNGSNTFTLNKTGTPNSTDLEYSKDKTTWTAFNLTQSTNTVALNSGEKLYIRSSTGFSKDNSNYFRMGCNQNYSVGGDIATLIDYQNVSTITSLPNYCFYYMIYNSTNLLNAVNLDFSGITSIGNYVFYQSFYGCTSLTQAPDFSNLTSVGDNSFQQCFQDTSLTQAPDFSNLTSVGVNGLNACFLRCVSLTTGSDLSNLTSIGNNSLTNLYSNCTSLNLATAPNISSWNTSYSNNWLNNVAESGVVRKPAGLTIPTDSTSGVPTGWTTIDY